MAVVGVAGAVRALPRYGIGRYVIASVVGGVIAAALGYAAGRALTP